MARGIKFTSVFYEDTNGEAQKTLKKIRKEYPKGDGWKEIHFYIIALPDGRFRVVQKFFKSNAK